MAKVNRWTSHGDVNPREHGGKFLRDNGDNFDIVEVNNIEHDCFKPARYEFKTGNVDKVRLMADKSLRSYADANQEDEAQNLLWAATACMDYGYAEETYETSNYHQGMRRAGIRSYV